MKGQSVITESLISQNTNQTNPLSIMMKVPSKDPNLNLLNFMKNKSAKIRNSC